MYFNSNSVKLIMVEFTNFGVKENNLAVKGEQKSLNGSVIVEGMFVLE